MKIFYHSADLDGHCSGAIVRRSQPPYLKNIKDEDVIGINYDDSFPWPLIKKDEKVYMVDFSLQPFSNMEKLNNLCKLVWIDHHESAIIDAAERGFVARGGQYLKIGQGACELTWEWFYGNEPAPKGVTLLGRYDVFDLVDGALALQNSLRMHDTKPTAENMIMWNRFFSDDLFLTDLMKTGSVLLQKRQMDDKAYAESCSFETEFEGFKCIAVNRGLTNSLMFESVYDPKRHQIMMTFIWRKGQWTVSLYTADEVVINVGEIAKRHGGGGHFHAAGFQCAELPFELK